MDRMVPNVTVVCGGQYGSEGKGKVAKYMAERLGAACAIRVGGPNSGHTVYDKCGNKHILRGVPSAVVDNPNIMVVIPPGAYIDPSILLAEIEKYDLAHRIIIDPNAVCISEHDREYETESGLVATIASTGSGTGSAMVNRAMRSGNVTLASNCSALKRYTAVRATDIYGELRNSKIIIEGTQGFGLSIFHTDCYPYATARDTTAQGFLSEAGIGPLQVEHVVLTLRAYPIRVGGNSGPMDNEIDWDTVAKRAGSTHKIEEYTSVTHRLRRVAEFDKMQALRAMTVNCADVIVVNHMDYIPHNERIKFIKAIESQLGRPVDFVGLSPYQLDPVQSIYY